MKNKLKKLMTNSWTIAILAPIIVSIAVSWFNKVSIVDATKLIFNFMASILNYKISIWTIVLSLATIVFVFYCYIKISNISEEKEPEWLKYTHDTYRNWNFKWTYEKNYYGKYSIEIFLFKPFSSKIATESRPLLL
jgi:hypothetical protein